MDLTPYIDGLRRDLMAAAAAGTDETRRTAGLLAEAMEPAARLAILDALSTATADVTAALSGVTVEIRMHGREPRISVDLGLAAAAGIREPVHVHSTRRRLDLGEGRIHLPAWGFAWLTTR